MTVSVLTKFIADEWFKIMIVLCFLLLFAALTIDLKFDNLTVICFSLAGVLWGIGEMACRPYREHIIQNPLQPGLAKIHGRPRMLNAPSIVFFTLASLAVAAGFWRGWVYLNATL